MNDEERNAWLGTDKPDLLGFIVGWCGIVLLVTAMSYAFDLLELFAAACGW